jgi:hypothetical protein
MAGALPLHSVMDRLDRAEEHIEELQRALRLYFQEHPYEPRCEVTVDRAQLHVGAGITVPPSRVSTLAGEALRNMHSALDHLACLLVRSAGHAPDAGVYFPVLTTPPTANKHGVHPPPNLPGVSDAVRAALQAVQPYRLGAGFASDPLYVLKRLSDCDKHRNIAVGGILVRNARFAVATPRAYVLPHTFAATLRTLRIGEDSAEVTLVPDDPAMQVKGQMTLRVVLGETEADETLPAVGALRDLLAYVRERVVAPLVQTADRS